MKDFLALGIRKSVTELTLAKLAFDESDFLDLIDFDFLDFTKLTIVDRFLIILPTPPPSARVVPISIS